MLAGMNLYNYRQPPPPSPFSQLPPRRPARESSAWAIIGITLSVVLVIGGLVVVGLMALFFIGLSHYGSNK
jgi:hypothetical protein